MYSKAGIALSVLCSVGFNSLPAQESPRSQEELCHSNIDLVSELLEGALAQESIENYDEMLSSDIILHGPALWSEIRGIDQIKKIDAGLAKGYKDVQIRVEEMFAQNDKVVVYWTFQGTATEGESKGRWVEVSGHGIYRVKEGKICEIWQSWDSHKNFKGSFPLE